MYMCLYIYPVRNPVTVLQNILILEYFILIVNYKWSSEWNSKLWCKLFGHIGIFH